MRIDWWVTMNWGYTEPIDEGIVFDYGGQPTSLVLVESEAELELVSALQLIYGNEIHLEVWDKTPLSEYRDRFARVYTTWDPLDRNRI